MPVTESAIESKIEKLKSSPGTFQRLAERYAYLTYPDRFKNFVPPGRNLNDVPIKGWPDFYSHSPDGRMDVAEVTHSRAWRDHLETDLEKAEVLGKGRLAGFLFVAWDNEPSPLTDHKKINPRYETLMNCRDRLIALGIPSDRVNFVFKKQLVHAFTQPRFASVLKEILGLPCHSLPFRLISHEPRIFGSARRLDLFAPAKEEYLNGLVHRAAITNEIEKRLEHRGWAWIRGRGATGKTVLAIQIALGYESGFHPAYYLDLAKTDVSASVALDVIMTLADDQVLFIVDNVHLYESFARDVFDHWQVASMGSRLLLLGREVSVSDSRGRAHPLDDLREEALTLEVRPDDLTGVFLRLARRFLHSPGYSSEPPDKALERWHDLFGGDLIAFSAAVAQRIKRLTKGDWQLQPQDAARYVQETYLEKTNEAEQRNLLRMAVLAQLEVDVPEEVIELAKIRPFLRGGIVHRLERGGDVRYVHYHLVHPGLGDLLLSAAGYSEEELNKFILEQFRSVARQNPFCGMHIANRLEYANRVQEAISLLKSIVESDRGLLNALIAPGLQHSGTNSERLIRLKVLLESEINEKLANEHLALAQSALRSPLHSLVSFLKYADRKLPEVYTAVAAALAQPESRQTLSETALRSPLDSLVSFLKYADRKLPEVYTAVAAALAQPESRQTLSETALRSPLDSLASFLEYADRKLPTLSKTLNDRLAEPTAINTIARVACRAPLDSLLKFLQTATVGPAVVSAIDGDEWDRFRLASGSEQPDYFPSLAGVFRRLGRPEMAEAPACALISVGEPQHWYVPGIGLHHLSHVMRLGRVAGSEAVLRFLARVVTPAWLEEQYDESPSYGVAAFLFSLWAYYEKSVLDYFRVEALKSRVTAEMRYLYTLTSEHLSGALQLLGCSALFGVCVDKTQIRWPNVSQVREAIRFAAPRSEMVTIGHVQIQLWLGLREMARTCSDCITVQAKSGDQALTLWKTSSGYTNKQNALNLWMIDWLERCAQSGWMLIPDHTPFSESTASLGDN